MYKNTILLQIWEESNESGEVKTDGCSLHIDHKSRDSYVDEIYKSIDKDNLPNSYDRIVGLPTEVSVTDDIFKVVKKEKSVRLRPNEMNNLLLMNEIILND